MNPFIFLFALFIFSGTLAFADQPQQVITLKDGSQIVGQLTGISNGVYTIKAPIIGDVHASASDVVSITNSNAPAAVALPVSSANALVPSGQTQNLPPNMDQLVAAQQQKLMANPQAMSQLQQIAQDPEIVQALQDPALMQAIANHDYKAVQNNPGVQKLMSNPQMQDLIKKLYAQQQNSPSQ